MFTNPNKEMDTPVMKHECDQQPIQETWLVFLYAWISVNCGPWSHRRNLPDRHFSVVLWEIGRTANLKHFSSMCRGKGQIFLWWDNVLLGTLYHLGLYSSPIVATNPWHTGGNAPQLPLELLSQVLSDHRTRNPTREGPRETEMYLKQSAS